MHQYPPQATDRKALALLLWRGLLRWEKGRLVHHEDLSEVRAEDYLPNTWTPSEDSRLRRLVAQKLLPSAIALRLGRTFYTVKARASALGLSMSTNQNADRPLLQLRRRPVKTVETAVRESSTWEEAGNRLGVSRDTVKKFGKKHGIRPEQPRRRRRGPFPHTAARNAKLARQWRSGYSVAALMKKYRISHQSVYAILGPNPVRSPTEQAMVRRMTQIAAWLKASYDTQEIAHRLGISDALVRKIKNSEKFKLNGNSRR